MSRPIDPSLRLFVFQAVGETHVVLARDEDQAIALAEIDPRGRERRHWEVTICNPADGPQLVSSVRFREVPS